MTLVERVNGGLRPVPPWVLYVLGAAQMSWLWYLALTGQLGVDPAKELEHQVGLIGLQLMVAVLAVSPLRRLTGINLLRFRRAIGVLAFAFVLMHFLIWLLLDLQLNWRQIGTDLTKRPFIILGFAAFLLLIPLAVTSNNWSVRRLGGAAWRRLHWLTYPAAVLGALHYLWLVRAWPVEPMIHLGLVLGLLALRFWWRRR